MYQTQKFYDLSILFTEEHFDEERFDSIIKQIYLFYLETDFVFALNIRLTSKYFNKLFFDLDIKTFKQSCAKNHTTRGIGRDQVSLNIFLFFLFKKLLPNNESMLNTLNHRDSMNFMDMITFGSSLFYSSSLDNIIFFFECDQTVIWKLWQSIGQNKKILFSGKHSFVVDNNQFVESSNEKCELNKNDYLFLLSILLSLINRLSLSTKSDCLLHLVKDIIEFIIEEIKCLFTWNIEISITLIRDLFTVIPHVKKESTRKAFFSFCWRDIQTLIMKDRSNLNLHKIIVYQYVIERQKQGYKDLLENLMQIQEDKIDLVLNNDSLTCAQMEFEYTKLDNELRKIFRDICDCLISMKKSTIKSVDLIRRDTIKEFLSTLRYVIDSDEED